jgi:hypothetical protein
MQKMLHFHMFHDMIHAENDLVRKHNDFVEDFHNDSPGSASATTTASATERFFAAINPAQYKHTHGEVAQLSVN